MYLHVIKSFTLLHISVDKLNRTCYAFNHFIRKASGARFVISQWYTSKLSGG